MDSDLVWVEQERRVSHERDSKIGTEPSHRVLEMGRELEIGQSSVVHSSYSLVTEGPMGEDSVNQSRDPRLRTFHFGLH